MSFKSALDIIRHFVSSLYKPIVLVVIFGMFLLSGCVGTRYLESNQSLLIKRPEIEGVKGSMADDLQSLVRQKPNKRLIGFIPFSYLVYAYEIGKSRFDTTKFQQKIDVKKEKFNRKIAKASKEKRINRLTVKMNRTIDELNYKKENGNWLMQVGEPLAIYDSSKTQQSLTYFNNYLISNGYFDHKIAYSVEKKSNKKVYSKFNIDLKNQYIIDSIAYVFPDSTIEQLLLNDDVKKELTEGMPYAQKSLETERDFIYETLTNNGYFTFSRQYIAFELDTFSIPGNNILLTEKILIPTEGKHQIFNVDSIQFFSSSNQELSNNSSLIANGIRFQFGSKPYDTDLLASRIFLEKDSLYSRANTIKTQQQLSYLDAFKFVNINYDSTSNNRLLANIFTSPLNRYQTSFEAGAVTASQQIPGPFVNLGIKNRNAFSSLDIIDLQGNFSLQGISNVETETSNYTLFQYGIGAGITFPKFLFINSDRIQSKIRSFNPQTRMRLSYNYEDRTQEYERSRAEFSYSYLWRREDQSTFNFTPFTFSFIDLRNLESGFDRFLAEQDSLGNGALAAAFNSSVISSTSFEAIYNFTPRSVQGDNSFLRLFVETGGNMINLLGEDFFLWSGQSSVDGFSLFRWAKINLDYRRVHKLKENDKLAYRFNIGAAFPYGNNPSLPYEKRFYIGGSNSLRAWQVRRLGPGAYGKLDPAQFENQTINTVDYATEQGGDMILEMSVEWRRKLVGFVDYAFFVDAGNIWLINSESQLQNTDPEQDDGFFKLDSFWKEIAIGAGFGIRLDFSFFVFRLDGAVQVYDPAQLTGNRWVIDNIPLRNLRQLSPLERDVLSNKTNITLGIGLPF